MEAFLREDVDLTYVTKVAVVPFENNSKEQFAAERIRGMVITQILAQGLFDVVDKSLVDSALREEAVDLSKAPMDAATMKRLGQRLAVQAFLLGSIDQAGVVQRGNNSYPELSITLRLVDTNTGMIFWQASGNRTGESMGKRLFGFSSDDDFKIALKLLRTVFATISAERKVKLPAATAVSEDAAVPEAVQHIEPQDDGGSQGQEAAVDEIAPEEPGEADGLNAPLDLAEPREEIESQGQAREGQDVPMGQDEPLIGGEMSTPPVADGQGGGQQTEPPTTGQEEEPSISPAELSAPLELDKLSGPPPSPQGDSPAAPDQQEPMPPPDQGEEAAVPLAQDKSTEPVAPAQGSVAEPAALSIPEVVPPSPEGEQAWPE